ncbi:MAG: dihydrofolate synthase / folylpolyglutamate synthase [Actinomycetota bacterium]|nr:dihydrofolate synthase / folylpolyglutamate synthase [Actinomycetota bacterium]
MPWSFEDALAYLEGHVNFEQQSPTKEGAPSLDRVRALAAAMGDPQDVAPSIHITGTNGKGSTARMVVALLRAHGLRVGLHTSPDLERINERLSIDGEPISDEAFAEQLEALAELEVLTGVRPTRFDLLTLSAFRWFADEAVDVAVNEVGLGGRWDSTNIANGSVAIVTNIGLDHVDIIGPTRADIATEKSGIVKTGATLVLGETDPALLPIFETTPASRIWLRERDFDVQENRVAVGGRALDLRTPTTRYEDVFLSLHGAHQGDNAVLAVTAVEAFFDRPTPDELVREALGSMSVVARFEVIGRAPLVILDGAHNVDGARAAADTLDDFAVAGQTILVFGTNRGHEPVEMLEALRADKVALVVATAADFPRAVPPASIVAAAESMGVPAVGVEGVAAAVRYAREHADKDDLVLVTGSLYVVGEARRASAPS